MTNKADIYNLKGEKTARIELPKPPFSVKVNGALLSQYVRVYLTNQSQGTVKTKARSEVRGGGKKPWRQKGTGRARAGSIRSPIWVGGGHTHAKTPHTRRLSVPKKMRRRALASSLSQKASGKNLYIVDSISIGKYSTKGFACILSNLGIKDSALFLISGKKDKKEISFLLRSSANLQSVSVSAISDIQAYRVLASKSLIIEKDALLELESLFAL